MKINFNKNATIVSQLTDILKKALPSTAHTGLSKDLLKVSPDPKGKGKSVLFVWRKATLKLTENLKVYEINFCNSLEQNHITKEAAELIEKALEAQTQVVTQTQETQVAQVAQEIQVAPVIA